MNNKMTKKTEKQKNGGDVDYRSLDSFEALCAARGIDPEQLPDVSNIPEEFRGPLLSAYRLMVGVAAVMGGKKVDFTDSDTIKYFPWVRVNSSGSGFGFSYSSSIFDARYSYAGSRLCTDDPAKTEHVFNVLNEDYKKWLI